ncbi:MAG: LTA synthase family protein [Planctomycetes bacterium]|nr:LTA synthase family protein [Planctomycetota bacterium]
MSERPAQGRVLSHRFGALALFAGLFLLVSTLTRVVLLAKSADQVSWDASLPAAFAWGALYDLGAAAWASLPLALALALLPARAFERRWGRALVHVALYVALVLMIFQGTAEWFFWDEFGVRFNFIAVDYLVYTTEVLANIRESYPLELVLPGVALGALVLHVAAWRTGLFRAWLGHAPLTAKPRLALGAAYVAGVAAFGLTLSSDLLPGFANRYNRELAKDGLWSLFAAFWDNELDYEEFYAAEPLEECYAELHAQLAEDGSKLVDPSGHDTLRYVADPAEELHLNVVQITVESLSADFLAAYGNENGITPHLDALMADSLVFDNLFATGTRTVRGMEALTLAIPPTPGRSIVKRPKNAEMFTLGSVLRTRGYDTAFLYGGYGYFDNMNAFFAGNGYRIVDRASVADEDVTFANAWGACDEDLYAWTLREADASHERGTPFHYFLMTTSNHRPYTYPEGRIDLPPKASGRNGAVKYTDYAIGEFLRQAATRPWFEDTVFVIVADHCSTSAGRTEIPLQKYHIPMLIYAPGGQIAPGHVDTLMSQMDYAPTLLGLLHWSYASRFFGHDVLRVPTEDAHALVGTYQLLGHIEHDVLTLLSPRREPSWYGVDWDQLALRPHEEYPLGTDETIAFYETASDMYRRRAYRELTPGELAAAYALR